MDAPTQSGYLRAVVPVGSLVSGIVRARVAGASRRTLGRGILRQRMTCSARSCNSEFHSLAGETFQKSFMEKLVRTWVFTEVHIARCVANIVAAPGSKRVLRQLQTRVKDQTARADLAETQLQSISGQVSALTEKLGDAERTSTCLRRKVRYQRCACAFASPLRFRSAERAM